MRHVCQAVFVDHGEGKVSFDFTRLVDDEVVISIEPGTVRRVGGHVFVYWPYQSEDGRLAIQEIPVSRDDRKLDDLALLGKYSQQRGFTMYPDSWCRVHDLELTGPGLDNGLIQPGLPVPLNEVDVVMLARGQRLAKQRCHLHNGMLTVHVPAGRLFETDAPSVVTRADGSAHLLGGSYALLASRKREIYALHRRASADPAVRQHITMRAVEAAIAFLEIPDDRVVSIFDVLWQDNTSYRRRVRSRMRTKKG